MAEPLKFLAPLPLPALDGWPHPNYPQGTASVRYHPGTLVACTGGKCVGSHGVRTSTRALPGADTACGFLLSQPWDLAETSCTILRNFTLGFLVDLDTWCEHPKSKGATQWLFSYVEISPRSLRDPQGTGLAVSLRWVGQL